MNPLHIGSHDRRPWLALSGIAVLAIVVWLLLGPFDTVALVPANVQSEVFSAERALDFAHTVMPDEVPHPLGSKANAAIRQRTIAAFNRLGYSTQDLSRPICEFRYDGARCAIVHNIVARLLAKDQSARPVLLTAHYDSVPAGPGVADDMSNVGALLEIARLHAIGALKVPLIFLLTDGEEPGTLGAKAASEMGIDADHVTLDLNLEARGTEGPSIMFEAGPASGELVDAFLRNVRPINTASYISSIYQLLPNDTDYSVFKKVGMHGLNFAFGGGLSRYHTPRDDFAHLSLASMQLQGAAVVGTLRGLTDKHGDVSPLALPGFVDLSHAFVVRWPASWTWPLVALCVVFAVLGLAILFYTKRLRYREWLGSTAKMIFSAAIALALVDGVMMLLRITTGTPTPWLAHTSITWAAVFGVALFVVFMFWRVRESRDAVRAMAGLVTFQLLGLIALTSLNAGLSALLLVQTIVMAAGLIALARARSEVVRDLVFLSSWIVSCLVFVPATRLFTMMLSPDEAAIAAVPSVLMMCASVLVFGRMFAGRMRMIALAIIGLASVGALVFVMMAPHETVNDPMEANVYQVDDVTAGKSWIANGSSSHPLLTTLSAAARFSHAVQAPWPRMLLNARYISPLSAPHSAAPMMDGCGTRPVDADAYAQCVHWVAASGYDELTMTVGAGHGITTLRFSGQDFPVDAKLRQRGMSIHFLGTEAADQPVELIIDRAAATREIILSGTRYNLSGRALEIASLRTAAQVPTQEGDKTIVYVRQSLDGFVGRK
ncbi:hypothetical protein HDE78_001866 [Rhodanobacter sp. K2T2]|uniref:M28 family peptidase n=1 Tax=Rhodanobacter sp. K2T2 TaxID=2723085 RepID=UPI0015CB19C4|nr:M28 family peptidase [Rhodanobacter sp. K2T2]NYE28910.1 hypothetical protein [Rhodanobacter sp. K2T2]